jgi:hypothetical protein
MSWLQSRERAQVDLAVEIFSQVEDEIRDFVRRDGPAAWRRSADEGELTPHTIGALLQRESADAVAEIEHALAQLHSLRERLAIEASRLQQQIVDYLLMNQAATQALRSSTEQLLASKPERDSAAA